MVGMSSREMTGVVSGRGSTTVPMTLIEWGVDLNARETDS
jgi:hypothetical protein